MNAPDDRLWNAFEDGAEVDGYRTFVMRCQDFGALVLPTGKIVACDPQFDLVQRPYSFQVEPGEYPVSLSFAGDEGVGLLMVQFLDKKPATWRAAVPAKFGVDSATAAIMDAKLARMLLRAAQRDRFERYWKHVDDEMLEHDHGCANVQLHEPTSANLIVFRTLGGDGSFRSYIGYSAEREPCCLVIDFIFLFEEIE